MVMISNNSSSICSPGRSNTNPRNSEINDPTRRSFSGNPFPKPSVIAKPRSFNPNTPANSPSDFPRRNSGGSRENLGSLCDLDDKENGKDQKLKAAKVRSPSSALKGTKNFMSPTISASSKITVSPRKIVLTERNEPARASISSSDVKSPILEVKLAESLEGSNLKAGIGLEKKKFDALSESDLKPGVRKVTFAVPLENSELKQGVSYEENNVEASLGRFTEEQKHIAPLISDLKVEDDFDVQVTLNPKNEAEIPFETATHEPDCVNLDPTFKLSPTSPFSSTSTILAPLDADPLRPPYDPKTNYLSPRPQFLHYRPKRRLYEDRDSVTLEESFISGSFSDTGITEETLSEDSEKESDDVSSVEVVKENEVQISEPSPTEGLMAKGTVEAEKMPKSRFFMRFKAISLLLLLSVACISVSVTNSPVIDPIMFEELSIFFKSHESSDFFEFAKANCDGFSEFAKANFDGFSKFAKAKFDDFSKFAEANSKGLARNFHGWFGNLVSSISKLISNFGGEHNLAHLHYFNFSALDEDVSVDQYPIFSHIEKGVGDLPQSESPLLNDEENGAHTEVEIDEDIEDISSVHEEQFLQDMEVSAKVEIVSDASEAEKVLESQHATTMEPSESRNDLQEADIEDISSVHEEQFLQDMEVSAKVETVSGASEAEKVLESQHATTMEPSESRNDLQEADIEDISSVHEEQFLQDMEVSAKVETVSGASEAEKVLESQHATTMEPSESRNDLQEAGIREPNHFQRNVDLTHQTGSLTSELHIEAFEASNQALEVDVDINAEKITNVDLKDQPGLNSEVAATHTELYDDGSGDIDLTHQTGSLTSELHIEAFEASNQALEVDVDINAEKITNVDLKDQPGLNSEVAATHTELYDDGSGDIEQTEAEGKSINVDPAFRDILSRFEAANLPQHMLIYVTLFISLIAAVAFNYSRKDNSRSSKVASSVEQSQLTKSLHLSAIKEQISLDKPSLRNEPTEMDVLGEFCPSEMSRFYKSSSYVRKEIVELNEGQSTENPTKKNKSESLASSDYSETSSFQKSSSLVRKEARDLNEAQSTENPTKKNRSESLASSYYSETSSFQKSSSLVLKETRDLNEAKSTEKTTKKNRRESLASSDYSMGSPTSYGSFTKYEKIPNKHRHGDENTVTPVRRSSRIRNQATSPL